MSTLRPAAFAAAGVLAMLPAGAHHALAVQYHVDREITVEGIVERSSFGNPHVRIYLTVDGEPFVAEGRPHATLLREGWTGSEIAPGDSLRVVGHPARDGSNIVLWRHLYSPDGREVWGKRVDSSRAGPDDLVQIHRAAIEHSERPPEDLARDASAKPHEVLGFMAAAPGMTILDFQAGTGYFTELLSRVVGEAGKVFAHGHPGNAVLGPEVFERRYGHARLPNVEPVFARHNELKLEEASLDAVLMSMVYHDTYWHDEKVDWGPVDQQALLRALYRSLRPGGTVLVIDHRAERGSDPYRTAMAAHRIDPAVVLRDFADAGFRLAAESDALANAEDALDAGIFEPGVYRNTDRFMLLFGRR